MPAIEYSDIFLEQFNKLSKDIQKKIRKAIRLLTSDPKHPSVRSKPIRGAKGVFEVSPDLHYRMTYERLPSDVLRLHVVGLHG